MCYFWVIAKLIKCFGAVLINQQHGASFFLFVCSPAFLLLSGLGQIRNRQSSSSTPLQEKEEVWRKATLSQIALRLVLICRFNSRFLAGEEDRQAAPQGQNLQSNPSSVQQII